MNALTRSIFFFSLLTCSFQGFAQNLGNVHIGFRDDVGRYLVKDSDGFSSNPYSNAVGIEVGFRPNEGPYKFAISVARSNYKISDEQTVVFVAPKFHAGYLLDFGGLNVVNFDLKMGYDLYSKRMRAQIGEEVGVFDSVTLSALSYGLETGIYHFFTDRVGLKFNFGLNYTPNVLGRTTLNDSTGQLESSRVSLLNAAFIVGLVFNLDRSTDR